MSGRNGSRAALALLIGSVALSSCEALLTDPRPPQEVGISFQIATQPIGGSAAAFTRVRRVALRFVRPDDTFRDTIVPALPVDGRIRTAISIPAGDRSEALGVIARLGYADTNLFEGVTVVQIVPGEPATAEVPLTPIAAALVADRSQLTLQGAGSSTLLGSAVLFASGDTIDGLQGTWTSLDPSIVAVGPLGVAVAQAIGQARLEVRLDPFADTVLVDVVTPTASGGRVAWVNAAGGSWGVGANWSSGSVPQPGDSVDIGLDGTYTVTLDGPPFSAPAALRVGGATGAQLLTMTGVSLSSIGDVVVAGTGSIRLEAGSVTAPVLSVEAGASVELGQGGDLAAAVTNRGLILVDDGVATISGTLTTAGASTIRIGGGTFASQLTVAGSFTNNGLIELYNGGRIGTASGTLINAPTATINTLTGPIGGDASVGGVLDNRGTITLVEPLRLATAGASHVNSGTITVNVGSPFGLVSGSADGFDNQGTLNASNGGVLLTLSGAGAGFTTTGSVTLGAGYGLEIVSGPFSAAVGSVGGTGSLVLRDLNASFSGAVTLGTTAPRALVLGGTTTLAGGGVTVPTGASVSLQGGDAAVPLDLQGGRLLSVGNGGSVSGPLTVAAGSAVLIDAAAAGDNTLTIANGFTNNGSIQLTNSTAGNVAQLTVGGTLVNATSGSIDTFTGAGGATHVVAATVQNTGAISLFADLRIQGQLVDPVGAPSQYLGGGGTLTVSDISADGAVFDAMPLVVDGALGQLDNTTFQNMDPAAVQLTINHPGSGAGVVTLLGLNFATAPTTGLYLRVVDIDGLAPLLVVEMLGATPASGLTLSQALGGATLIW